jgi:hypothetical protein
MRTPEAARPLEQRGSDVLAFILSPYRGPSSASGVTARMCGVGTSDAASNPVDEANVEKPEGAVNRASAEVPLKSRIADSLDVHGGVVLLASGIGLIALACVFADKTAVASIFAVFGALLMILGGFYSRIEGNLEATKEGVKMTVRSVQRRARALGLPPEAEDDAIERAIDRLEIPARGRTKIRRAGEIAAAEAVESLAAEVRAREHSMLRDFARWLEETGDFPNAIRRNVRTPEGWEYDLIADGREQVLIAEAKIGSPTIGAETVRQIAALPAPADPHNRRLRRALVVPFTPSLTQGAVEEGQASGVEVYAWSPGGHIHRWY